MNCIKNHLAKLSYHKKRLANSDKWANFFVAEEYVITNFCFQIPIFVQISRHKKSRQSVCQLEFISSERLARNFTHFFSNFCKVFSKLTLKKSSSEFFFISNSLRTSAKVASSGRNKYVLTRSISEILFSASAVFWASVFSEIKFFFPQSVQQRS